MIPSWCMSIQPFMTPSWWQPPHSVIIEDSKEAAKESHDRASHNPENVIEIYTDGSGIGGGIGAEIWCVSGDQSRNKYIGKDTDINVYAAELEAINMAANLCEELLSNSTLHTCVTIFTDSQPAITATIKPRKQSGQSFIKAAIQSLERLKSCFPETPIVIKWIPGHRDIHGNERADEAAKHAAQNPITHPQQTLLPSSLKSSKYQAIEAQCTREWESIWNHNPPGKSYFK